MNDQNDSSIFNFKIRPYPLSPGWSTSIPSCEKNSVVSITGIVLGKTRCLWIVLIKHLFVSKSGLVRGFKFCVEPGPVRSEISILCLYGLDRGPGPNRSVRDEPVFVDPWYHSDNIYFPCWWIFVGPRINLPDSKTSKRHRNGLYD